MEVTYAGRITVEVMGVEFDVPVDYSETISMGIQYE